MVASDRSLLPLTMQGAIARKRATRLIGPVDLKVTSGAPTILIGPNGAGKTSLLRLMHGLLRVAEGSVTWAINDTAARARQAYVFQAPTMMRRRVIASVAYPLILQGMNKADARVQAIEWIKRVGLEPLQDHWAPTLSGGEKQKLALARALIYRPEVVFLDEPTANLDGRATREIERILLDAAQAGTKLIMATHDMGQARRMAGEVLFVYDGKIHEKSEAKAFFNGPKTTKARAFIKGDIVE